MSTRDTNPHVLIEMAHVLSELDCALRSEEQNCADLRTANVEQAEKITRLLGERDEWRRLHGQAREDVTRSQARADELSRDLAQARADFRSAHDAELRLDADLTRVRLALTEAGIPESEPYPEEPSLSAAEKSLRAGGKVIAQDERVRRLVSKASQEIGALRQTLTGHALYNVLYHAEAALADIGDAAREPGDDLKWCERRAAKALPPIRAALRGYAEEVPAERERGVGPAADDERARLVQERDAAREENRRLRPLDRENRDLWRKLRACREYVAGAAAKPETLAKLDEILARDPFAADPDPRQGRPGGADLLIGEAADSPARRAAIGLLRTYWLHSAYRLDYRSNSDALLQALMVLAPDLGKRWEEGEGAASILRCIGGIAREEEGRGPTEPPGDTDLLERIMVDSPGAAAIAVERARQMSAEGWTPEHDDEHGDGAMAWAAVCYAAPGPVCNARGVDPWPWDASWDKREKHPRTRRLIIAGALISAEIDRLLRVTPAAVPPRPPAAPSEDPEICTLADLRTEDDGPAEVAVAVDDLRSAIGSIGIERGAEFVATRFIGSGQALVRRTQPNGGPNVMFVMATGRVRKTGETYPAQPKAEPMDQDEGQARHLRTQAAPAAPASAYDALTPDPTRAPDMRRDVDRTSSADSGKGAA